MSCKRPEELASDFVTKKPARGGQRRSRSFFQEFAQAWVLVSVHVVSASRELVSRNM